ncbi:catalase, partial [Klebsiella pneumoniae]|uniref:catalase n=1 Tax=Klebsiella pneumoniae TaxID=573 RepID=UPI00272E3526
NRLVAGADGLGDGAAERAVDHEPWVLWFSCILSGLGGTLFDPPRAALVVKLVRPHQRGRFFSILMLEDFILREKITHFDHERIPERIVHARGS